MRLCFAILLAAGLGIAPATAEMTPRQEAVLGCLGAMGAGTNWGQCVGLMFEPCADQEVGSDGHVACLTAEHAAWQAAFDSTRVALVARLTSTGSSELTLLMGQWFGYVAQKCAEVASSKSGSLAEAAQLGCEISEIAGVTEEFVACHQARSTAPYCVIQE